MTETTYAGYSAAQLRELLRYADEDMTTTDYVFDGENEIGVLAIDNEARKFYDAARAALPALLDAIARLEASNARLRGALVAVFNRLDDVPDNWAAAGVQARAMARNALAGEARDAK